MCVCVCMRVCLSVARWTRERTSRCLSEHWENTKRPRCVCCVGGWVVDWCAYAFSSEINTTGCFSHPFSSGTPSPASSSLISCCSTARCYCYDGDARHAVSVQIFLDAACASVHSMRCFRRCVRHCCRICAVSNWSTAGGYWKKM